MLNHIKQYLPAFISYSMQWLDKDWTLNEGQKKKALDIYLFTFLSEDS